MKTQVIVVAAGTGSRLKSKLPKALVDFKRKPLVFWSLDAFEKCSLIDGVVLVGHKSYLNDFKKIAQKFPKVKAVIPGGQMRADSVRLGLSSVDPDTCFILVHDAARPLIDQESIRRLMAAVKLYKAAILAVPVKPTIKMVGKDLCIQKTLSRSLLWEAQTPQGFDRAVLMKAHGLMKISATKRGGSAMFYGGKEEATDDAMLAEQLGIKVKIVMGNYSNIKVTTAEDLAIAERMI